MVKGPYNPTGNLGKFASAFLSPTNYYMSERLLILPAWPPAKKTAINPDLSVPKEISTGKHETAENSHLQRGRNDAESNTVDPPANGPTASKHIVAEVGRIRGRHDAVLNMSHAVNEPTTSCHPQDFELPKAVKSRVDAEIQQANAFAITTALFAGALLSLVQLEVNGQSTPAWQALRFFTYTAITINLTGTTLALVLIKLCSDIESVAVHMILSDPASLPARISHGDKVPIHLLGKPYELLEQFGMPRGYRVLDFGASIWITAGNLFTFVSVTMWVWLAEDVAVAGASMIGTVPALAGLVYAFTLTRR
ncbi:hypothetical protein FS842_000492 [Serendipita sp. 407]|nr:hypothetical protein FS842_000492 [Serendipita sp. 407]